MSYLDWKVGDRVVCMGGTPPTAETNEAAKRMGLKRPRLDSVYTLREVAIIKFEGAFAAAVRLDELDNRHITILDHGGEPAFLARRFRRVATKGAGISIFTAMLNTTKKVVDA